MGKLEGDEPAPHENHPGRQVRQIEKLGAGRKLVGPGKRQRHGKGAGGQNEKPGLERLAVHDQGFRVCERGRALDKIDAHALEALAGAGRDRIGKGVFPGPHRRPVRLGRPGDALARQVAGTGHGLGSLVEIFFGLAAGQGADAPGGRAVLHDGHLEAVFAQCVSGRLSPGTGPHHHDIEVFHARHLSKASLDLICCLF
jgi:hypothetical protein